jgi:hypothetical protein
VYFELAGEITDVEVIAEGSRLRQLAELEEAYGRGHWRKLKGTGIVRMEDGSMAKAEIHWYEAHGIGRKRLKIKRFLDRP